jgi:hypothetical protein
MVRDDVDDDPDSERGRLVDQLLRLGEPAERRIDIAVIGDVVAAVRHRRGIPRREPDRVDAKIAKVRKLRANACEIADPVTVPVREAANVDLIDRRTAPPRAAVLPVPERRNPGGATDERFRRRGDVSETTPTSAKKSRPFAKFRQAS